ncbi:MAG: urea ABC transporter permease subunit UrtB, partial [Vibrio sp.]
MKRFYLKVTVLMSWLWLSLLTLPVGAEALNQSQFQDLNQLKAALIQRSSGPKEEAINFLSQSENSVLPLDKRIALLQAWEGGDLYALKESQALYVATDFKTKANASLILGDGEAQLMIDNKRDFSKVRSNNKLRSLIKSGLASLQLGSSDPMLRFNAANQLAGNLDQTTRPLVAQRLTVEDDDKVKQALEFVMAVDTANSNQTITLEQRLSAIEFLSDKKEALVYQTLNQILNRDFATEQDTQAIHQAAQKGINQYEQSQKISAGVETLFFGLSLGSVLVLAGIGLAITFGVMGVINMAHGELIMIGAYTTYVVQLLMPNSIGLSLFVAIPAAFLVTAAVGILIERTVIRRLYGRPLETLLATFGISLILQQAVRSIFSPLNRSVSTPDWMSGMLEINPMLSITYSRLYIIFFCLAVFFALMLILKRTPLGLQVRAVSQNRAMARAMGVHSERVDAMTFGLGAGIAGVAGVALSQLTNVGPGMGQDYIIDSFMVVVFGGVGNLWGTLVAGFSLGILNKVMEPWVGAVLAKILILGFIILFIQKRP